MAPLRGWEVDARMSRPLVEAVRGLRDRAEALPAELRTLQDETALARDAARTLAANAQAAQARMEEEAARLPVAAGALQARLGEAGARVDRSADGLSQALTTLAQGCREGLARATEASAAVADELAGLTSRFAQVGRTLQQGVAEHDRARAEGQKAVAGAWSRLETSLLAAEAAARELGDAAGAARLQERRSVDSLTGALQGVHRALAADLQGLRASVDAAADAFEAELARLLDEAVRQPSDRLEAAMEAVLQAEVRDASERFVELFVEEAVLYLGQRSHEAEGRHLPPTREALRKQLKRYEEGPKLIPLLRRAKAALLERGVQLPGMELIP